MHVGKALVQLALKQQMHHGRRDSVLPQPDRADVMVKRKNVENARYILVNDSVFFLFFLCFFS